MKGELVLGAIIGDVLGTPYERLPFRTARVDVYNEDQRWSDDSILTVATMECMLDDSEEFEKYYMKWGKKFINEPIWGGKFREWLRNGNCKAINHSFGNGCLMRVSPIAYYDGNLEDCKRLALISCQYTHNNPDSFLAVLGYSTVLYRNIHGMPKDLFGIDTYGIYANEKEVVFDCTVKSVKCAYASFEGFEDFMNCVAGAIKLGGDTDTIGAMTGALAETVYSIPQDCIDRVKELCPDPEMWKIVVEFSKRFNSYVPGN